MWIGLEQVRYLAAISDKGSFGAAAAELRRAKSAISAGIKNLEDQLGFAVLDRSSYRVKLTVKGEAFLFKARRLLEEAESLKDYARLIASNMEMKVSLSASELYPLDKVIDILSLVGKRFPNTEIEFHREVLSGEYMLVDDMIDIAIISGPPQTDALVFEHLKRSSLPILLSSSHPIWSLDTRLQTREMLESYPNIVQASTIPDPKSSQMQSQRKWRVHDYDSKVTLIKAGLGWGRLPKDLVAEEIKSGSLRIFADDREVDIFIARKRSKHLGLVGQFIWNYFLTS